MGGIGKSESAARIGVLWTLQALAASVFLLAALGKLIGAEFATASFDAIGAGDWLRYSAAGLEIVGAVALFIPRLTGPAGLAFTVLMACAAYVQAAMVGEGAALPLAMLFVSATIAWGRRASTVRLWNEIARR